MFGRFGRGRDGLWGYVWLLGLLGAVAGCGRGSSPSDTASSGEVTRPPETPAIRVVIEPPTNMVRIPAGTFRRGTNTVTLSRDFWLCRTEVTQAEFEALLGRNPSFHRGEPDLPVEKVTFADAQAYCAALTGREREAGRLPDGYEYRLPTEAEWEYACRAGTTNLFSFGDAAEDAGDYAWTWENSEGTTHRVAQKQPNPWGLHDMHGNVWEWCLDWFGPYPPGGVTDPTGVPRGRGRVFRGGGWNNEAKIARSSTRFAMEPTDGIHFVGFRVALAPVAGPPRAP